MPLNMVIGNKGTGKTSFLVFQGWKAYFESGEQIDDYLIIIVLLSIFLNAVAFLAAHY